MDEAEDERNVVGGPLRPCSHDPETGYRRDGTCHHLWRDPGRHEVCAVMTDAFLTYTAARGNDLSTPRPEMGFPGLEPGDRWCVCLGRWVEAERAGVAPPVVLEATAAAVADDVDLATLRTHEYDGDDGRTVRENGDANATGESDEEGDNGTAGETRDPPF